MAHNANKATVTVPLDVERHLRYDFNAVAELEAQVGMTAKTLLTETPFGLYHLRAMLWAGLLDELPELTVMETTGLLDRMYGIENVPEKRTPVVLADGNTYELFYDTFAIISLELELNCTFSELADMGMEGVLEARAMLWAGLLHAHPHLTIRDAGKLLDRVVLDNAREAMATAILAAFSTIPERTMTSLTEAITALSFAIRGPEATVETESDESEPEGEASTAASMSSGHSSVASPSDHSDSPTSGSGS